MSNTTLSVQSGERSDTVDRGDIARRAYQIWEAEGRLDGRDITHWLKAEAELAAAAMPMAIAESSAPTNPAAKPRRARKRK